MRIAVIAVGSLGDVQPYVALGRGLRAAGHQVQLVATRPFEALIRNRGLEFFPLQDSPQDVVQHEAGRRWLDNSNSTLRFGWNLRRLSRPLLRHQMADCLSASQGADVVIVNGLGVLLGSHVAEKLRLPLIRAFYCPVTPTRAYPVDASLIPLGRRLGGTFNLASHLLVRQLLYLAFRPSLNAARRDVLGLPALPLREPSHTMRGPSFPLLYGFSSAVLPKQYDWGDWIHVTGYWFLDRSPDWQPPAALVEFLESGPPPVYVGFGSMNARHAERMTSVVGQALARAGRRGVLLTGSGGRTQLESVSPGVVGGARLSDTTFAIEAVPFDWLFPRVAAAVHHGGAGTTAAAIRAGVPSVVIPFFADQPFWAARIHALGVGPRPIPLREVTAERLSAAILATEDPEMRRRAQALGQQVRAEDGVARAVELIEQYVATVVAG